MASDGLVRVVILLLYLKNAYSQQNIGNTLNAIANSQGMQFPANFNVAGQRNGQQLNFQDLINSMTLGNSGNYQQQGNAQRTQQKPVATLQLITQPGARGAIESSSNSNKVSMGKPSNQPNQMGTKQSKNNQAVNSVQTANQQALIQNSIVKQNQLSDKGIVQSQFPSVQNSFQNANQDKPVLRLIAGQPIITSIQFEPGTSQGSTNQESNFKTTFHPISPAINQQLYQSQQNQVQTSIADALPVQYTLNSVSPSVGNQPIVSYMSSSVNSQPIVSYQSQPLNYLPAQPTYIQNQPFNSLPSEQSFMPFANNPSVTATENPPLSPSMSSLMSYILSEMQSPSMPKYPGMPSYPGSKQGSKSSLKSILPLLFNLLQERHCGCHNRGCMDNNDNANKDPQIFDGYSNQIVYGQRTNEALKVNNELETDIDKSRNLQNNSIRYVVGPNSDGTSDEEDSDDTSEYEDDE